jgi:hypothetical protein
MILWSECLARSTFNMFNFYGQIFVFGSSIQSNLVIQDFVRKVYRNLSILVEIVVGSPTGGPVIIPDKLYDQILGYRYIELIHSRHVVRWQKPRLLLRSQKTHGSDQLAKSRLVYAVRYRENLRKSLLEFDHFNLDLSDYILPPKLVFGSSPRKLHKL